MKAQINIIKGKTKTFAYTSFKSDRYGKHYKMLITDSYKYSESQLMDIYYEEFGGLLRREENNVYWLTF